MRHVWALAVLIAAGSLVFAGQGNRSDIVTRAARAARPRYDDPIRVGMVAPDFELVRFADVNVDDASQAQQAPRVKLSSFRGKKPVLLLLSSFT